MKNLTTSQIFSIVLKNDKTGDIDYNAIEDIKSCALTHKEAITDIRYASAIDFYINELEYKNHFQAFAAYKRNRQCYLIVEGLQF